MITSGEPKRCYWNSNLIAQTFGGEGPYMDTLLKSLKENMQETLFVYMVTVFG